MSATESVSNQQFGDMIIEAYNRLNDVYVAGMDKYASRNEIARRRHAFELISEAHRSVELVAGLKRGDRAELFCMSRRYREFVEREFDSNETYFEQWYSEDYQAYFADEFGIQITTDPITKTISEWTTIEVASFLASEIAYRQLETMHKKTIAPLVSDDIGTHPKTNESKSSATQDTKATIQQATMLIYYLLSAAGVDVSQLSAASVQRLIVWLTGTHEQNVRVKVDQFIYHHKRVASKQAVKDLGVVQAWLDSVNLRSTGVGEDIEDMTEKLAAKKKK